MKQRAISQPKFTHSSLPARRYAAWLRQKLTSRSAWPIWVILTVGLMMAVIIPPMQGGDEPQHFMRAYQLSEGHIMADYVEKSVGGTLPSGIVRLGREGFKSVAAGDRNSKFSVGKLHALYRLRDDGSRSSVTFANTAVYSPVAYAPAVGGIWIGRILHMRPLAVFYMARLSAVLCGVAMFALALWLLPFGRLPFTVAAMIPMTLSQISIVTADTTALGLSFILIALLLRLGFRKKDVTATEIIIAGILSALIGITKPGLFPMTLISLVVFQNPAIIKRNKYLMVAACFGLALVTTLVWNGLIKTRAVIGYQAAYYGVYDKQLAFITHHPLTYGRVLYESFLTTRFDDILVSFYGKFGWLDAPMPLLFIIIGYAIIGFSIFIASQFERVVLRKWFRGLLFAAAVLTVVVSVTSQYLFYVSPKMSWIYGMQGRYFIPPFLLLIVGFLGARQSINKLYYQVVRSRILILATAELGIAIVVLLGRYYTLPALIHLPG